MSICSAPLRLNAKFTLLSLHGIKVPVDGESAKRMFEETGVDGIMIGRGAIGRPWIFKQVYDFLSTGEYDRDFPSSEQK